MNNYSIKKTTLQSTLACFLAIIITFMIAPYNTNGDQISYIYTYEALADYTGTFFGARHIYISNLSGFEVTHFIYIYMMASLGIGKIYSMAFANALLAYIANAILIKKFSVNIYISLVLIFTNYYTYSLFFTLERLKFSAIALLLASYIVNKNKRYLCLFIAVLSHLQSVIIIIIYRVNEYVKYIKVNKLKKLIYIDLISLTLIVMVFNSYIITKISAYLPTSIEELNYYSFIKLVLIGAVSYYLATDKKYAILIYSLLVVPSLLTEPQRFMMFGYAYFMYFALTSNKKYKLHIIAVSAVYYAKSTIDYLLMIIKYGG
jgi:hypothetical protein